MDEGHWGQHPDQDMEMVGQEAVSDDLDPSDLGL